MFGIEGFKGLLMSPSPEHVSHALIAEDDDDDFEIFSAAIEEVSIAIVLSRAENRRILIEKLNHIVPSSSKPLLDQTY